MNIFFDTESTGLVPNTTLISIGMVAENGEKFYAEFTDYNKELVDDWIQKNVISNLIQSSDERYETFCRKNDTLSDEVGILTCLIGRSHTIRRVLTEWLKQFNHIQLISDVCHFDMTLLCNLFGGAFSLPKNVNPCCYDISQMYAEKLLKNFDMAPTVVMPVWSAMKVAFDKSREELCMEIAGKLPEGEKHNALYDAEVIKMIYEAERSMR